MGYVLQNSYIKSKGRGALIKAPYGIIRNNYFEGGAAGTFLKIFLLKYLINTFIKINNNNFNNNRSTSES